MKAFIICFINLFIFNLYAINEISFEYGHQKQLFGSDKENSITTTSYSASLAMYFYDLTAVEFNYSQSEDITSQEVHVVLDGYNLIATGVENTVSTKVYGIGIRQAFAPKRSFIRPLISLGYARQVSAYEWEATYLNTSNDKIEKFGDPIKESSYDSMFATFILQIRIMRGLSLQTSIKSIIPAFEFDRIEDNIKYMFGCTWIF